MPPRFQQRLHTQRSHEFSAFKRLRVVGGTRASSNCIFCYISFALLLLLSINTDAAELANFEQPASVNSEESQSSAISDISPPETNFINSDEIAVIRINRSKSDQDIRSNYNLSILRKALNHSVQKYGPYRLEIIEQSIPNYRKLQFLRENKLINVAMAMTSQEREQDAIPIRIPIRRGILNYRLLMVHKKHLTKFENITTAAQLQELTVGLRRSWALWDTMSYLDYKVVSAYSYDSVFKMLAKERFDYIPRGIHEIYDEIAIRKKDMPALTVAPKIALYIPAAFYIFVAPNRPEIAHRIEYGLEQMLANNEIVTLFNQFYGEAIKRSDIANRHIINVGNPLMPAETPFERKALWQSFEQ